jgi:hypothetical protein
MIGSLSHLIRGAAIDAIITSSERITRVELDRVQLDRAAEQHHATTTTTTPRRSARRDSGAA